MLYALDNNKRNGSSFVLSHCLCLFVLLSWGAQLFIIYNIHRFLYVNWDFSHCTHSVSCADFFYFVNCELLTIGCKKPLPFAKSLFFKGTHVSKSHCQRLQISNQAFDRESMLLLSFFYEPLLQFYSRFSTGSHSVSVACNLQITAMVLFEGLSHIILFYSCIFKREQIFLFI